MPVQPHTTKVILAGAGPGDPELITLKLQKALAAADVIICDRLVNPLIISQHAKSKALVIQAGKQGYHDKSLTQAEVTALILEHARDGKTVLRLKGGDVAIFSNVLDELEALYANQIPFEIIPGITAASGAAAYAGIPLTARGYAQGVQFHAFNPGAEWDTTAFSQLASFEGTVVFYMASRHLSSLVESLLQQGANPQRPLAVLEQATTIHQQVHTSTLSACMADFSGQEFSSPALVIVGEVVNLHQKFSWFSSSGYGSVFNALK